MKKSGMVLAELVIALCVCGVILGVSIYMFRSNDITKTPYIYSVLKNLPTVNKLVMAECVKRGLCTSEYVLPDDTETYCALLSDIFATAGAVDCTKRSNYEDYVQNFRLSNGVAFYDVNRGSWNDDGSGNYQYYDILIDVNGEDNGDDVVGKDIFPIRILKNGGVIPSYNDDYEAYTDEEFFAYRIILDRADDNGNNTSRIRTVLNYNGDDTPFIEKVSFINAVCASNPADISAYFPEGNITCPDNSQLDNCKFTDTNNAYYSDKTAFCAIEPVKPRGTGLFKVFGI